MRILSTITKVGIATCAVIGFLTVVSCEKKGPAERTGESIDKAVDDIKDGLDPRGPAEKAGDKIDSAVEKVKDKVEGER